MIKESNGYVLNSQKLFGFYSAILSCLFYLVFDIAAILAMTRVITEPFIISLSWYAPSLLLSYTYLGMIITIYQDKLCQNRVYALCAIALGVIYTSLNSITYVIQLVIIAPSFLNNTFSTVSLFEMAAGKPLYAVNGLAYTLMGFSTLFLSLSIKNEIENRGVKIVLFIHGIVAPAVFGALFIKEAFYISSTVALTYPLSAILIARYFWKTRKLID